MSDDLVKRLRDDSGDWPTDLAADRIEELEAKLAKAVDTLMFYGGVMPNAFLPIQDGGEKARNTLAELKS